MSERKKLRCREKEQLDEVKSEKKNKLHGKGRRKHEGNKETPGKQAKERDYGGDKYGQLVKGISNNDNEFRGRKRSKTMKTRESRKT